MAVRMVPLAPTLRRMPRMVARDRRRAGQAIASRDPATGEVDKQIADGLFEPLLHLIRNAIDHGVETVAAREAAGKPAQGRVTLSASATAMRSSSRWKTMAPGFMPTASAALRWRAD
jgi:two-component system chemotaxis sensor kinase CheA